MEHDLITQKELLLLVWSLVVCQITELFRCFVSNRKLQKSSSELEDKLDALSLNELSSTESKSTTEQRLIQLENIFSFPTADSSSFPQNLSQEFTQQLQHLPTGKVVDSVLDSVAKNWQILLCLEWTLLGVI